jgi:aspartate/methionine/tyrosine aminotransferase
MVRTMATLSESAARIRPGVFAELQRRIDAHAARGGTLVPLHIGDTHLAPPAAALFARALEPDAAAEELYRYGATAGLADLRGAIAERARGSLGIPGLDGEKHVHVACGATHALFCAARSLLDAGDEVLVAAPYWPLSVGIFHACSARPVEVPFTSLLYEQPSQSAGDLFASRLTTRTKALYFTTPNNPDGKVLTRGQLESVARFAIDNDLWVFSDEVYADVAFDLPHVSIASLPGMAERTIVALSFSKSFALAGARVGAVIAPEAVILAARRLGVHTVFNVPVVMQRAALAALGEGTEWIAGAREEYRAARDAAVAALAGSRLRGARAEGGAYLFLDFAEVLGERPLSVALERAIDHGVLLAPGDAFGRGYERCARLCFTSVPRPALLDGIARLRAAVESL